MKKERKKQWYYVKWNSFFEIIILLNKMKF